ncbi:3,9-dihydroxypterocarpan 6A-monooxygenase-like [Senna tora]|uniref:3,9-dihydroxypterocarpan 6A-monooxygenase-like n=1 Tax=Senna tora TaxID=362788 RepID=A0A834TDM4_9FABA|nr:3,9-dihydroxypterocarpan 6A-monooxygenase-like [Senna tora]
MVAAGYAFMNIRDLLRSSGISIKHVLREANFCADALAKIGAHGDAKLTIWEEPPPAVKLLLLTDMAVIPKCFQTLARRYGPLLHLRLGSDILLVSNSQIATQIFKTHEINFSNRPEFGSADYYQYKDSKFFTAPYGPRWRFMKKLCLTHLLSASQIARFTHVREEEMKMLLSDLTVCSNEGRACNLSSRFTILTNNIICRMAMSTTCDAQEILVLVTEFLEVGEIINHPQVLKKLREELNSVVGSERLVKESDVKKMKYLHAVVKEVLRLHPPTPFTIRQPAEDCNINGYHIKSETRTIINIYAIMRDPETWEKALEFIPERFMHSNTDQYYLNLKYFPFGIGRRSCPGSSLALAVVHVTIAALIQKFDWKAEGGRARVEAEEGPRSFHGNNDLAASMVIMVGSNMHELVACFDNSYSSLSSLFFGDVVDATINLRRRLDLLRVGFEAQAQRPHNHNIASPAILLLNSR